MNEEKKAIKSPFQRVALEVVPCAKTVKREGELEVMNHENQDDPCVGKIILSVMAEGSKLTKADAGRLANFSEEVFVTAKITPSECGKLPIVEMTVSEKCHASFVKSDGLQMPDALNACNHGNA